VLDCFVDGFNQLVRPGEVLLQNLPMRLEGGDFFEIGPAHDLFDLLQLEPQLPVKQDLLESQELWLLVEPVAIRPEIGRLQQARFIIKMKRAHTDARHRGHLFDCISHRFFPAGTTMATAAALHSRVSRNVRVKGFFLQKEKFARRKSAEELRLECADAKKKRTGSAGRRLGGAE
jgi:hypothetical protein